jgi:hypothetical protein
MGNGGIIGLSMLSAGINIFNAIRKKRYIESEKNRLRAQKLIEGIDISEDLTKEHQTQFNQSIEELYSYMTSLYEDKDRSWYKTSRLDTQDLTDINDRVRTLSKNIQMVQQNDAAFGRDAKILLEHPKDFDQEAARDVVDTYDGSSYGGMLFPKGVPAAEWEKDLKTALGTKEDKSNPKYIRSFWLTDPAKQKPYIYYTQIQDPAKKKGVAEQMLFQDANNPRTYQEMISFSEKYPISKQRSFADKLNIANKTGIYTSLRNDPIVQDYAANVWGVKNIMPYILQDVIEPQKSEKPDKPEEPPYDVYDNGQTFSLNKEVPIVYDNKKYRLKTISYGRAALYLDIPKTTDTVTGNEIPERTERKDVPIGEISDELYTQAPYLKSVFGKQAVNPLSPNQKPYQAQTNWNPVGKINQKIVYDVGGEEYTHDDLISMGYSKKQIAQALKEGKIKEK